MAIHFPCANPQCGFEIVMSARSAASEIRCPNCGLVQPAPELSAPAMATKDAPPQPPRARTHVPIDEPPPKEYGFLGDGLRSIQYAVSALPRMLVVTLSLSGARVLYDLAVGPWSFLTSALGLFELLMPLAMGVACYAAVGIAVRYFQDVGIGSLDRVKAMPDLPRLPLLDLFEYGLRGLGVLVLYVLNGVGLPLLPLALLAMCYSDDARLYDVRWAWRTARRFRRELATVWGLMFFWCGALGIAAWGLSRGVEAWTGYLIRTSRGDLGPLLLASTVDVLGAVAMGLVGCVLLCVLLRCVGLLGRYHPEILDTLPDKPPATAALVGYLAGGAAASLLVWYGISWLLGGS
jgi:hypothetical protein